MSEIEIGTTVRVTGGDQAGQRHQVVGVRRGRNRILYQMGEIIDRPDRYEIRPFTWYLAENLFEVVPTFRTSAPTTDVAVECQ